METIKSFTTPSDTKSIAILVLGDVGRSPRMQRHAEAMLHHLNPSYHIHIIGFMHSGIKSSLRQHPRIKLHNIHSICCRHLLGKNSKLSFILYAVIKVLSEIISLLWILLFSSAISSPLTHLMMQNPPSVPTLVIAKFVCMIRASTLIVDWHNFGFSILALKQTGMIVRAYQGIERYVGQFADVHLTVSKAMRSFLIKQWHFDAQTIHVLYDRPTDIFVTPSSNKASDVKLWKAIRDKFEECDSVTGIVEAKGSDLWLVSSTSWTPDEDLNMLLDENVLQSIDKQLCDVAVSNGSHIKRRVILFVTGKDEGCLREQFMNKLELVSLTYVRVVPLWLESYADYVQLVKRCDAGLCFHLSSSGLDLPMKVVDMFGAGLPVIAVDFSEDGMNQVMGMEEKYKGVIKTALGELVQHDRNGFVFRNAQELTGFVMDVYRNKGDCVDTFKRNIEAFRQRTWDTEWRDVLEQTKTLNKALDP